MGAYRGQIMKNGRETLFLGQILTFKWHFITISLASSPFVRTTQTESRRYVGSLFVLYRLTKGLEGGGVCASKRFARDNPNEQQSMAQTEQPGGLFIGARRQRRKSLRPHHANRESALCRLSVCVIPPYEGT